MNEQNSGATGLSLVNVSKIYRKHFYLPNVAVLDNLSLEFPAGKCTALLGANGAGKTTSIRMLLGLLFPSRGEVLYNGHAPRLSDRAKLGYMPETSKLPQLLTVRELLSHHLDLMQTHSTKKERHNRIDEGLHEVGLFAHQNKRIRDLSKGMGRRVAWLQATLHQPTILILDEPMSGLDPLGRAEMAAWIQGYRQTGATILLCTHELEVVRNLCDHVHVLRRGKLVYTTIKHDSHELHGNIQSFKDRYSLTTPSSTIFFSDYATATAALKTAIEKGQKILNFREVEKFSDEDLLQFFKSDSPD